jgi:GxxExxY protein
MSLAFGGGTDHDACSMLRDVEKPENQHARAIIGASIEVHRQLGPGLLERAYEACLAHELAARHIHFVRQVPIPVVYKGQTLDCGFRADIIVEGKVLLEVKAVAAIIDIHKAQALTYLKLTGLKLCLILNFHALLMRDGTERVVLGL